jgi:quinol monooxygenase YgiN
VPQPLIIVDSSHIREGKLAEVKAGMKELVEFAVANEPRMIAYSVYFDENHTEVTVFQMHPDSESAKFHMQAAAPLFSKFAELLKLSRIDVYGRPSQDLLERLRRKAEMLGGGAPAIHELHAGFARVDVTSPETGD